MIDKKGLRLNVGIILMNPEGGVFWGRRIGSVDIWQFPQGGILPNESPQQAMYRELNEEIGLTAKDVELLAESKRWISYYLPPHLRRHSHKPVCIGQKQKWFCLKLIGNEATIYFNKTDTPEFTSWRWVDYWYPLTQIVDFKKTVYKNVLEEFAQLRPH